MNNWNLADIFEKVASVIPERPALAQGQRKVSWAEVDRRANALAADLLATGLKHQSKVGTLLYNCPEYMETYLAAFKASLVPFNTNYRYGAQELLYLWNDADTEAVILHASFLPLAEQLRPELPAIKRWYVVAADAPLPPWAQSYEGVVEAALEAPPQPPWQRSGDDLMFLYTGGTTGLPKGVMWRQDDLFNVLGGGSIRLLGEEPPVTSLEELGERVQNSLPGAYIPACPLMHGTGQFGALISMWMGNTILYLEGRSFRADELWRLASANKATGMSIVGDAFARPMIEELDKHADAYDLSSIIQITSSGAMWSQEVKDRLLKYIPQAVLIDAYGSSEAIGLGAALTTADTAFRTARFLPGETLCVVDEQTHEPLGPGETGLVAMSGFLPQGYYKRPEPSGRTFVTLRGQRYAIPGDYARMEEDGSITLLGRGSVCINTGGEKVFPEEVEETLKLSAKVTDAICVAAPDERFGQIICAVVEPTDPHQPPELPELAALVREHLASYKAPRLLRVVESIGRSPSGKADYPRHAAEVKESLGL